jgi:NAD(P)-dependent dehydrogenase (short-subunit alcohol dehydrogenase family)
MRVLLHGHDERIESALRGRGLAPVREGIADALVTMGPAPMLTALAEIGAEEWRGRFKEWVEDAFWAFQTWLREVLARGVPGHWVAITSTLGSLPFPRGGADGASVVALQTLVRIAAIEYGSRGVRANAIAPGWREPGLPPEIDPELADRTADNRRRCRGGGPLAAVARRRAAHR